MRYGKPRCGWLRYDISCGLHSCIPLCCILWYITGWKGVTRKGYDSWLYDRFWYPDYVDSDIQYIRCPICLLFNRRVKIETCGCADKVEKYLG